MRNVKARNPLGDRIAGEPPEGAQHRQHRGGSDGGHRDTDGDQQPLQHKPVMSEYISRVKIELQQQDDQKNNQSHPNNPNFDRLDQPFFALLRHQCQPHIQVGVCGRLAGELKRLYSHARLPETCRSFYNAV